MAEVVVVGARGYTGSELLPLLWRHPDIELKAVGSRSAAGQAVADKVPGLEGCALAFSDITPASLGAHPADAYVLALPNGQAKEYVAAIDALGTDTVVVDLSADHRFDDTWVYGQPERFGDRIRGARRIANPGCYATGMQLALAPLVDRLRAPPVAFGVSGYSGAGRTPSRRNDPDVLRDNLLPYALADHVHEREVSHHLGHEVRFLPHVAPFFRGISLTVSALIDPPMEPAGLEALYRAAWEDHPLVTVQEQAPEVAQVRGRHGVIIGGFTASRFAPGQVSLVCVLDNLLKGAATQALQNLNLAFGLEPMRGLPS